MRGRAFRGGGEWRASGARRALAADLRASPPSCTQPLDPPSSWSSRSPRMPRPPPAPSSGRPPSGERRGRPLTLPAACWGPLGACRRRPAARLLPSPFTPLPAPRLLRLPPPSAASPTPSSSTRPTPRTPPLCRPRASSRRRWVAGCGLPWLLPSAATAVPLPPSWPCLSTLKISALFNHPFKQPSAGLRPAHPRVGGRRGARGRGGGRRACGALRAQGERPHRDGCVWWRRRRHCCCCVCCVLCCGCLPIKPAAPVPAYLRSPIHHRAPRSPADPKASGPADAGAHEDAVIDGLIAKLRGALKGLPKGSQVRRRVALWGSGLLLKLAVSCF